MIWFWRTSHYTLNLCWYEYCIPQTNLGVFYLLGSDSCVYSFVFGVDAGVCDLSLHPTPPSQPIYVLECQTGSVYINKQFVFDKLKEDPNVKHNYEF